MSTEYFDGWVIVAWRTFDGEGGYEYRSFDENEHYKEEFEARNPRHLGWVEPLFIRTPEASITNAV